MSSSPPPALAPEITPAETYQIDSDEYDSDQERDDLEDDEYDKLVEEAENGYSDEEMEKFILQLKESGLVNFLRDYLLQSENGEMRSLRKLLLGFGIIPPSPLRNPSIPNIHLLPFAKIALSRVLRRRQRLSHLSSLEDALNLLKTSKNIIVLSGAGISTSCGIPDFRSSTGLYAQLQDEGKYELDDPQQMFDIHYFRERPEVFYSFAKQIYPSNFVPSPCHRWIKLLEDKGLLLRNYTQNIDTLESLAGVEKVLQCHGSFKTASCLRCKNRVPGQTIEPFIMSQHIPYCPRCQEEVAQKQQKKDQLKRSKGKGKARWDEDGEEEEEEDIWGGGEPGIMKPDITFFGQALDSEFDECLFKDREEVDLLVIIGTSLKVAPVSEVLTHIPHSVPQIYINLTPVHHVKPDICLLGDADSIVTDLSSRLGWTIPSPAAVPQPSPEANGDGNAQKIETKIDRATRVTIPPEEGEWIDGIEEASHIHLYRRKGSQNPEKPQSSSDPSSSGGEASPAPENANQKEEEEIPTIEPLQVGEGEPEASDGYVSDESDIGEERPSKRARGD
uniref:NAD-dependent histone deacetylase SIR2 n=1 Tax=Kwoniella bestiolae CBS 10118 TaxID=1296100 RepID=A0A1B9G4H8_9TREE|nr:NAD-dependent histone deacetylase SIR2 [Kwoniella bestiolae CBS 10118]OCF25898.1 NAD-dependent histone deacetylase SIR2 [Kwoniella bestiolae CBS 10118]